MSHNCKSTYYCRQCLEQMLMELEQNHQFTPDGLHLLAKSTIFCLKTPLCMRVYMKMRSRMCVHVSVLGLLVAVFLSPDTCVACTLGAAVHRLEATCCRQGAQALAPSSCGSYCGTYCGTNCCWGATGAYTAAGACCCITPGAFCIRGAW